MSNVVCHEGECDSNVTKEKRAVMTIDNKILLIGGYVLFALALGALTWFGASAGYYPDLSVLQ
jgi:hypothetical protein